MLMLNIVVLIYMAVFSVLHYFFQYKTKWSQAKDALRMGAIRPVSRQNRNFVSFPGIRSVWHGTAIPEHCRTSVFSRDPPVFLDVIWDPGVRHTYSFSDPCV
jgi:hypothetical protein